MTDARSEARQRHIMSMKTRKAITDREAAKATAKAKAATPKKEAPKK